MSEFSLLKGVTVVILVTFRKIGLSFSVYNISKNYTWYIDTLTDIYKICQSGFFSSPVSHLNSRSMLYMKEITTKNVKYKLVLKKVQTHLKQSKNDVCQL